MIPSDDQPVAPVQPDVEPPPPRLATGPFWDYQDLLAFISLIVPEVLITGLVVRLFRPFVHYGTPFLALLAQLVLYALIFCGLYALFRIRYDRPFWRSLGWQFPFRGMAVTLFGGPLLAIGLGLLGALLRTPEVQPFQQMLNNRPTLVLFALFGIFIGPLCEELAFRGFLMPLLIRSLGAPLGIVITAVLFGMLHGPEYSWSWQLILLITAAGTVFGWVRYKTGSTAASTFMHSAFNLTQFAGFLGQGR